MATLTSKAHRRRQDSNPGPPGFRVQRLHVPAVSTLRLSFFHTLEQYPVHPASPVTGTAQVVVLVEVWLEWLLWEGRLVRFGSVGKPKARFDFRPLVLEEEAEAEAGQRGEDRWRGAPSASLPAFRWVGERPGSGGQRSVPRGKAGSAAGTGDGTGGGTGGGAADSGPQRAARQRLRRQILRCRSLPPPPQRTSEARKQRFRRCSSKVRTQEYHVGWMSMEENNLSPRGTIPSIRRTKMHLTQIIRWLPGINHI